MLESTKRLYEAISEFDVLRRHCTLSKNALDAELQSLHAAMDEHIVGMGENELDAYLSDINDHYIETAEALPRVHWYSELLLVFAHFEKTLNDLCTTLRAERKLSLSVKELSGQGITRARNYMAKLAGINAPFMTRAWNEMQDIATLRNVIAHRYGYVDYEPNKADSLYSRLSQLPGVLLTQETANQTDAQVMIDDAVVTLALRLSVEICDELLRSIDTGRPAN